MEIIDIKDLDLKPIDTAKLAAKGNYSGRHLKPMEVADIAYLAGLIDGEGTIQITKKKKTGRNYYYYYLRLRMGMSHAPVLEWCLEKTGLGFLTTVSIKKSRISGLYDKPHYVWTAETRQAEQVLRVILPYLKVKKEEAELALEFAEHVQKVSEQTIGLERPESHWDKMADYRRRIKQLKKKLYWPTDSELLSRITQRFEVLGLDVTAYDRQYTNYAEDEEDEEEAVEDTTYRGIDAGESHKFKSGSPGRAPRGTPCKVCGKEKPDSIHAGF